MNRTKAFRARAQARRALAYRAWFTAPSTGDIPPVRIMSDPRLQARERERQLRRAQFGFFDSPATVGWSTPLSA